MTQTKVDTLLKVVENQICSGDTVAAITTLIRAIKELQLSGGGGIPSLPTSGNKTVTNLYVENGKLRVIYEE